MGMIDIVSIRKGRDLRQSEEYGQFMQSIGWKPVRIDNFLMFVKKIGPLSVAKSRRANWPIPWNKIRQELTKNKTVVMRIDPEVDSPHDYKNWGFKRDQSQLVGTKTLLIDIRSDEDRILSGFKTETRYKIRKFANHLIKLNDFDLMYRIIKEGYRDINLWCPPPYEYFGLINSFDSKCFCLTIDDQAGCVVIIYEDIAEYYYASSTKKGKENNLPYLVVWEAMKEAKKRGAKVWDFNGLYDERWPDKRWKGFSFFKKRFGGEEMEFGGSYTMYKLLTNW